MEPLCYEPTNHYQLLVEKAGEALASARDNLKSGGVSEGSEVEIFIKVVEIKSDEEQDEATPAKEDYAEAHFERVNKKLSALNLADLESRYRSDAKQHYSFDLLTPHHFPGWIADLKKGKLG